MGRPKIEGPRPWDVAGVSKSKFYRDKNETGKTAKRKRVKKAFRYRSVDLVAPKKKLGLYGRGMKRGLHPVDRDLVPSAVVPKKRGRPRKDAVDHLKNIVRGAMPGKVAFDGNGLEQRASDVALVQEFLERCQDLPSGMAMTVTAGMKEALRRALSP